MIWFAVLALGACASRSDTRRVEHSGAQQRFLSVALRNRVLADQQGMCAAFGADRVLHCWGETLLCEPSGCSVGHRGLVPCGPFKDEAATEEPATAPPAGCPPAVRCAAQPQRFPIAGVTRIWGDARWPNAAVAHGEVWSMRAVGTERSDGSYGTEAFRDPLLQGAITSGGHILYADGTVIDADRVGRDRAAMRFKQLVEGRGHACGIAVGGDVLCWGDNIGSALARPSGSLEACPRDASRRDCTTMPQRVRLEDVPVHLSAFDHGTCATLRDGRVQCWGTTATLRHQAPSFVLGLVRTVMVGLGHNFGCALHEDGTVSCWGSNHDGALGDGTQQDHVDARRVPGMDNATELAVGPDYACVVTADLALWCWGQNDLAQFGNGTFDDSPVPVQTLPAGTISPGQ